MTRCPGDQHSGYQMCSQVSAGFLLHGTPLSCTCSLFVRLFSHTTRLTSRNCMCPPPLPLSGFRSPALLARSDVPGAQDSQHHVPNDAGDRFHAQTRLLSSRYQAREHPHQGMYGATPSVCAAIRGTLSLPVVTRGAHCFWYCSPHQCWVTCIMTTNFLVGVSPPNIFRPKTTVLLAAARVKWRR